MSKNDLEIKIPHFNIRKIDNIKILYAVNVESGNTEAFVPLSMYLKLLDEIKD